MSPSETMESFQLVSRSPKPLHQLTRASLVVFELVKPSPPRSQASSKSSPTPVSPSPRYLSSPIPSSPSLPILDRRSSASSTASSTESACSELMLNCIDTLAELLQDESTALEELTALKTGLGRRPGGLTAEQVELWNQVVEQAR